MYIVLSKFKVVKNDSKYQDRIVNEGDDTKDVEIYSAPLDTKEQAEALAETLSHNMGFECKVEPYDTEPLYPYGCFQGEE